MVKTGDLEPDAFTKLQRKENIICSESLFGYVNLNLFTVTFIILL